MGAVTIRNAGGAAALGLLMLLAASAPAHAGLAYQYRAPDGSVVYTDEQLDAPFVLVKRVKLTWGEKKAKIPRQQRDAGSAGRNRGRFEALIRETAQRHKLRPELLHAVITVESAYDPNAVSHAGAVGLMQLMPATAKRFGVDDRRDPVQNLDGGARYLRYLLSYFDNDLTLAVAAYNAGENAVEKYGRSVPPYRETQGYVVKVLRSLRKQFARPAAAQS
ncbi:MAG: lytic transglycosylase domain-containing protein [Pseudomonadota bacterium]